jgi:protein TonB
MRERVANGQQPSAGSGILTSAALSVTLCPTPAIAKPMTFDPATLCARTTAGEAEIAVATNGLSLSQRRVLSLLEDPAAFDELAARHRIDSAKLTRDLARLAELRLIRLQEPLAPGAPAADSAVALPPLAARTPRATTEPSSTAEATGMAPIVIGRDQRRTTAKYLGSGGIAAAIGLGIWFGTRTTDPPPVVAPAASASMAIATAPASAPAALAAPSAASPVMINPLAHDPDPLPETKRALQPALMPLPANAPKPMPSLGAVGLPGTPKGAPAAAPPPSAAATPAPPGAGVAAPTPVTPSSPAAVVVPAPVPAAAAAAVAGSSDTAPPIVLAIAAAAPPPARPTLANEVRAIQRDQPVFPREAIAAGITAGSVKARLHIDAGGSVTGVDILSAQPQRVFDRAVRGALQRWQFEPGGATRTTEVEVAFQRD